MTAPNSVVRVGSVEIGNNKPLSIIAGPCALESRDHALEMASALKEIMAKAGVGFIYKTSFDKANRTSANSVRGLGIELALPIFAEIRESIGTPVVFDATHSVQQPGGQGTSSGGERDMVPVLARAAVAIGVAAVFMETHQDPDSAPSDGPNMLKLKDLPALLAELVEIDRIAKRRAALSS